MNPVEQTYNWFKKSFPNPTPRTFEVQLSVHLEEVAELLESLGLPYVELQHTVEDLRKGNYTEYLEHTLSNDKTKLNFLDSVADQYVTGVGLAYNLNMDYVGAINEVNRSNYSKFDEDGNPFYNEFGKIAKGPNYTPPDLTNFI